MLVNTEASGTMTEPAAKATIAELRASLAQAHQDFEALKEAVVDVASRYAEDNGWCDTIDRALSELGLQRKPQYFKVQCQVSYWVTVAASTPEGAEIAARYVFDEVSLSGDQLVDREYFDDSAIRIMGTEAIEGVG